MKSTYYQLNMFAILCLFIATTLLSCKKNTENYPYSSIQLKFSEESNGYKLEWDKLNTTDFVRYEIYRSTSPIPEPTKDAPINSVLLLATISNSDRNFFIDSTAFGQSYYRVQVIMKMRKLISNQVTNSNGVAISGFNSQSQFNEETHLLYLMNSSGQMSVVNTSSDQIVVDKLNVSGNKFWLSKNQSNQDVVYVYGFSNSISEYNAQTLSLVKLHSLPINSNNVTISNNHIYICEMDSLVTYNLANDTRVDGQIVPNCYQCSVSATGNALLVTGFSSSGYASYFLIGANHKPVFQSSTPDATYFLYNGNTISPLGNYITTSQSYILSKGFSYITTLSSLTFGGYSTFTFTSDEKYIIGRNFSSADVYDVSNGFTFKKSFNTSSTGGSPSPVFIDGNSIIIVETTFDSLTGQSITIIRKKTYEF